MIRNDAPQNPALLFNVGASSAFSIKATAKSFNILSSGLYANKIRAVLRELGCNAWDSHVAAGRADTPFDLHVPTALEPWFSVRDYGTGLDHREVVTIYTTYFESTKTHSNDFVGALGLGSKSPFSYTDNFTVTAIKHGRKGIYTAYINEQGVPAIALMYDGAAEEGEPAGVEVKFAVLDARDMRKFEQEAREVFARFAVKPVVNVPNFEFDRVSYRQRDLIEGVHQLASNKESVAVMGNIAYPIQVPNAEQNLGELRSLLNCGLEIHFPIGALDFQASREGLSYVPSTVAAIREKLEELNSSLYGLLVKEVDQIENPWQRALFLDNRYENSLWSAAVISYVNQTQFELYNPTALHWCRLKEFSITVDELAEKYNIALAGFSNQKRSHAATTLFPGVKDPTAPGSSKEWHIRVSNSVYFAENDTRVGAVERGKYHWRLNARDISTVISSVYIANPADRSRPMKFAEFMSRLMNPHRQCKVSEWSQKRRATSDHKISVLKLEKGDPRSRRTAAGAYVWREMGDARSLPDTATYYYLPLSGFALVSSRTSMDPKRLCEHILHCGIDFEVHEIYGVRKADLDWVKDQSNWINLEDHVAARLNNLDSRAVRGMALSIYKIKNNTLSITDKLLDKIVDPNSAFVLAARAFKEVKELSHHSHMVRDLVSRYAAQVDPLKMAQDMATQVESSFARYPLIKFVTRFSGNEEAIADYINLIDRNR